MNPQTFFDHFERLTDAPNAVARLRELILQLAVQGKLVAQDERDEPAARLLERIAAERKRLIREKKIKEAKPLPPVSEDEVPFEIPDSWRWVRLAVIGLTQTGTTPSKDDLTCFGNEFPFIKPADILPNSVDYDNEGLSKKGVERYGRLASSGSVVMVCIGTIGKVNVIERDCSFNQQINSLTPLGEINSYLVNYFLRSKYFQDEAWIRANRTTIAILNKGNWEKILFPLPPLEEQKRIVAKVDELMRLCDVLERKQATRREARLILNHTMLDQLLAACDATEFQARWRTICDQFTTLTTTPDLIGKLRQTILQLAVQGKLTRQDPQDAPATSLLRRIYAERERLVKEKRLKRADSLPPVNSDEMPFALPSGWAWTRLGQLGITQTGTTPPTSNASFFGNDFPFVKPADINPSSVNYDKEGLSKLGVEKGRLVPSNSVLMVCIGGSIGKVGLVDKDCSCNQQINYITLHADMPPQLFYYFLKSPYFQDQILSLAPSTTLPILSKGKWDLIGLPLPPFEEQKRIVAVVNQLMVLCDELEANLRRAEEDGERLLRAAVRSLLASASEISAAEAEALVVQ